MLVYIAMVEGRWEPSRTHRGTHTSYTNTLYYGTYADRKKAVVKGEYRKNHHKFGIHYTKVHDALEAEVEKKSNCKSPGFDFYYSKADCKQEMKQSVVNSQKAVLTEERMENKRPPHRWTFEEDILCCRRFFEQYVEQRSSMDLQYFAQQLHWELPEISVGSLRMKAQNIQQLCREHSIRSSLNAKPLTQYSQQNRRAFVQVKKEFGL